MSVEALRVKIAFAKKNCDITKEELDDILSKDSADTTLGTHYTADEAAELQSFLQWMKTNSCFINSTANHQEIEYRLENFIHYTTVDHDPYKDVGRTTAITVGIIGVIVGAMFGYLIARPAGAVVGAAAGPAGVAAGVNLSSIAGAVAGAAIGGLLAYKGVKKYCEYQAAINHMID